MSGSYSQPLVGYPGQVWATGMESISWLHNQLLTNPSNPAAVVASVLATYQTLRNGASAVAAYQTAQALAIEAKNLAAITEMSLGLDTLTQTYVDNRAVATAAAASGVASLYPPVSPFTVSGMLAAGTPAVADPMFLEWCINFTGETPPTAFPASSGILACANAEITAWQTTATAIQIFQGTSYLDYRYDAAARTVRTAQRITQTMEDYQSGPFAPVGVSDAISIWNTVVAGPSILLSAASLMSAPSTLLNQQASVIRYDLLALTGTLAQLLLSLRSPNVSVPGLATLNIGQSLQDLAASQTGNIENWISIAQLNNLMPPYPGASNNELALSGKKLLLPPTSGSLVAGAPPPNYAANVLGTDWDFGPINGAQPAWIGDIPLITGYLNFARAIGRRLQTPLGSLIYHKNYGSRIPPEVGAVQGQDEAAKIERFGVSAIEADPRTSSVLSSLATIQPNFLTTFAATVQPIGPGSNAVQVNETIQPLP